jgi:hypothetical protein
MKKKKPTVSSPTGEFITKVFAVDEQWLKQADKVSPFVKGGLRGIYA